MIVAASKLPHVVALHFLEAQKGYTTNQRSMAQDSPHLVWIVAKRARLSSEIRAAIFAESDGVCVYCNENKAACLDHVFPHSRGGPDDPDNLVGACADCNNQKRDMTPEEWLGEADE